MAEPCFRPDAPLTGRWPSAVMRMERRFDVNMNGMMGVDDSLVKQRKQLEPERLEPFRRRGEVLVFGELKTRIAVGRADEHEFQLFVILEREFGDHLRIVGGQHQETLVIEAVGAL